MWWKDEAFERTIVDAEKNEWSFKVWSYVKGDLHIQRIFFWDSKKNVTGMVEFKNDQVIHFKRIKDRLIKLAKNKAYRDKFVCPLKFPLENHY